MRRHLPTSLLLLTLIALLATPAVTAEGSEQAAKGCAAVFGEALKSGDAAQLRKILPSRGKVQMRLMRLGPEDGDFSASQVEAVFQDFLKRGAVRAFEVIRVEYDKSGYALIRARASLVDSSGSQGSIGVHLALQPEGDRWVLTSIRELPR